MTQPLLAFMVATFMGLIMTGRVAAMVALIFVPTALGLLAGFGPQLGPMMLAVVKDLAPTGVMLIFTILYARGRRDDLCRRDLHRIFSGTGMVEAMSRSVTSIFPPAMGPYMAPITALPSVPFTYFISDDVSYFGCSRSLRKPPGSTD